MHRTAALSRFEALSGLLFHPVRTGQPDTAT